jgi:protein-disulfide isomerase
MPCGRCQAVRDRLEAVMATRLSRFFSLMAICWLSSFGCGSGASSPAAQAAQSAQQRAPAPAPAASTDTVAVIDGERVSLATLDQAVAPQIARLDEEAYELRKQQLDELINERLFSAEAKRRGLTVPALIEAEVTAKAGQATDADVQNFVATNRRRLPPDPTPVLPQVRAYINTERTKARREAFASELRARAHVQVMLKMPAIYRAPIDLTGAPVKGPDKAPVTIVEFSDFHCPYCRGVQSTLQQVLEKYPNDVRLVYKHYPIDSLHPQARRVAEASWCAQQQQRFWEFHDAVYASPPDASDAAIASFATKAGLDIKAFDVCVASGKAEPVVQAHISEGEHYGVSGTPGFFVNGRLLSGAVPLNSFSEIIDEEIAASKTR